MSLKETVTKHTGTALHSGAWSCALNSEQLASRCRVLSSWLWEVFLHTEIPLPLLAASSALQFRALSPCWWLFPKLHRHRGAAGSADHPRAVLCWAEPALGPCSSVPMAHAVLLVPSVPSLTLCGHSVQVLHSRWFICNTCSWVCRMPAGALVLLPSPFLTDTSKCAVTPRVGFLPHCSREL